MPHIFSILNRTPEKAYSNLKKHAVTFEESATVFKDPNALSLFDLDHSKNDDIWITLGLSEMQGCLL